MSSATGEADKQPSLTSTRQSLRFSLEEIQSATNEFDDELVIGHGGFGKVYKATICVEETSHVVAIKRLDSMSNQGAPEFRSEIEMLSKLRHCHLVSLMGFCDDNNEMILVYVYMPNGTLDHHLHKAETPLNWMQRLKIAVGAGRGLDYLHTGVGTHHGVIHRDVKTSNILLDENWEAMISDFGLSKIGPINQSISCFDASVKGTFGYLDPEFFYTRKLTRKTDVYAFGVVLFELLSGRLAVDDRNGDDQCSLVRWAQRCVKERKLDQIVDSKIRGTIFPRCLRGFAKIADRCLRSVLKERPTMAEVVVSLQALLELQQRHDNPAEPSGVTRFTWKIHKYLVSSTKQNSEQHGTSSSKSPENDMNQCSSTYKDGNNQGERPLQHEELVATDFKSFTYNELRDAANNFDYYSFLGHYNPYGRVYKGWIDKTTYSPSEANTGLPVTIKRLANYECADRSELEMLKEFRHPNLEKLIGYCLQGKELFLVYEFMPNKNFENLLSSGDAARLPLVTKVKIAVGIARGILFLHKIKGEFGGRKRRVDELNLGRHEILLDEDFTAKLSGYDVTKLVRGRRYHGYEPVELQTNLEGFTVLLAELVTAKEKETPNYGKTLRRIKERSFCYIAKSCFEICNEVDSESRMLTILHPYVMGVIPENWIKEPREM